MRTELHFFLFGHDEILRHIPIHMFGDLCRGAVLFPELANSRQRVLEALISFDESHSKILPGPTSLKGTTWLFTPTGSIELSPSYDEQEWAIESNHLDLINKAHEALAQDNHRSRIGSPADRPVALAIYISLCANKETFIVYLCNTGKSAITDVTDKGSSFLMPEVIELAQEEDISWSSAAAILSEREITESQTWDRLDSGTCVRLAEISVHAIDFMHWISIECAVEKERWLARGEVLEYKLWNLLDIRRR